MSIKESMMNMIEEKVPGKTKEELVEKLFELDDIDRKEDKINVHSTGNSIKPKEG